MGSRKRYFRDILSFCRLLPRRHALSRNSRSCSRRGIAIIHLLIFCERGGQGPVRGRPQHSASYLGVRPPGARTSVAVA